MNLDRVALHFFLPSLDPILQPTAGVNMARSLGERVKDGEFASRKHDWVRSKPNRSTSDVEDEVTNYDGRFGPPCPSARECPNTRSKLGKREGLAKIVVGARIEAIDPILDHRPRGEQEHRYVAALAAPTAQRLKARPVRQGDIEHDGVVLVRTDRRIRLVTTSDDVRRYPFEVQANFEALPEDFIVFNDQNAHDQLFQAVA